jgi:two-component system sensor histidine kinase KdpD
MMLRSVGKLPRWGRPSPLLGTLGIALAAFLVALPINILLDQSSLSRVFLVAVLITAITYGLWPSLFASLISVLIYDFFFIPPVYSLSISSTDDVVNLGLFGITAIAVSTLAARVRRYAVAADARALTAEKLAAFNRRISMGVTMPDVIDTAAGQMAELLHCAVVVLLPEAEALAIKSRQPASAAPDAACLQVVASWWESPAAQSSRDCITIGRWQFHPLRCSDELRGLVGIHLAHAGTDAHPAPLLAALVEQTALAIDRIALRQHLEDAHLQAEKERLRSSLLASVSHDLRNPLASIVGSASGLERHWRKLPDDEKLALIRTARSEAERLDGYIANLLDITRIEAHAVTPHRDRIDLSDILNAATHQAKRVLAGHRLKMDLPDDLPMVEADTMMLQQVFYNVIENAAKYAPPGSEIRITAHARDAAIEVCVLDQGPGIPAAERDLVFEKFYRATNVARQAGTGLGLAICFGFLQAMRGSIEIRDRDDTTGTVVAITLPATSQQAFRELEIS